MPNDTLNYAKTILGLIRQTSDNLDFYECYYRCANKHHISNLIDKDPQVIWGRRGTGKTTLLKAFTYYINNLDGNPNSMAGYILMKDMIPSSEEIKQVVENKRSLNIYILSQMITELCMQLEKEFVRRKSGMESAKDDSFTKAYVELDDYLKKYKAETLGNKVVIVDSEEAKTVKDSIIGIEGGIAVSKGLFNGILNLIKRFSKQKQRINSRLVENTHFYIEIAKIREKLSQMLEALGVSTFYLCLDEFCELDKIEDSNMQIQVAELIKQLFFKNSLFSVKIASIWNLSNMYSRGRGKRAEGIELNNDIFPGPDLDMMFVRDGVDAQTYFKDVILNIYLLSSEEADSMSDDAKQRLSNLFEESIFGNEGFRHLIIGSQGVSRAFSILVKKYLEGFTKHRIKYDPLNPHQVYRIIIDQYVTGINSKLPRYTLCNVINEYVRKNQCRYFLIARADYDRCKQLLKWLESRELYRQMPSNLTDSAIREKYKLFVIHYGNYLEALSYNALESGETKPQAGGMRKLSQDAETEELVPKYNKDLISTPEKYLLNIPKDAEKEMFCIQCNCVFQRKDGRQKATCPHCQKICSYDEYMDEENML